MLAQDSWDASDITVGINAERHYLLAIGLKLRWLSSICSAGNLFVVDAEGNAAPGRLCVAWDGSEWAVGWLQHDSHVADRYCLTGDAGTDYRKYLPKNGCVIQPVDGVIFDNAAAAATSVLTPVSESRTAYHLIKGYSPIDIGSSAEPVLIPGDVVLVSAPVNDLESSRLTHLRQKRVVAVLSTGERVFKIMSEEIKDKDSTMWILENISGGESHRVRAGKRQIGLVQGQPYFDEIRLALGYWFTSKRQPA